MMDHRQLIDELAQQTAALEAALLHQEWEQAEPLVARRLELLKTLAAEPPADPQLLASLQALVATIRASEQEMIRQIESAQLQVGEQLRGLQAGNKATHLYQQNR